MEKEPWSSDEVGMSQRPSNQRDHLCHRCKGLDIAGIRSSTGLKLELGLVTEWSPGSCTLCSFLVDHLKGVTDIDRFVDKPWYLFSKHTKDEPSEQLLRLVVDRLLVLSTEKHGDPPSNMPYIVASNTFTPSRLRHVQPLIDFSQPRGWLDACTQLHADLCGGGGSNSHLTEDGPTAGVELYPHVTEGQTSNLRLIDCFNDDIVPAIGNEPYVALSYVWGNDSTYTNKKREYPKTIQDAMFITRELGYRWLWVDKYCINQDNKEDFLFQLQQMDAIYQKAVVTIVAAAGGDTRYGIPGVNANSRKQIPSVTVGDEHLYTMPNLQLQSATCKWLTRAWTFQEGLLSIRRLVFTGDQLYFECRGCYSAEMLDIPEERFRKLHAPGKPYFHQRYRNPGRMGIFPLNGCGVDPWDLYNRISEYSERSLTHDSDIINGILGIFRAFERMATPMRHIHGIPFPQGTSCINETRRFKNSKRVWPLFSESLQWRLERPSKRRAEFPSWSWVGWYGRVLWPAQYTDVGVGQSAGKLHRPRNSKLNENAFGISIEHRDGTSMSWEDFQANYSKLLSSDALSRFISIEVGATPVAYVAGSRDEQGRSAHFLLGRADGTWFAISGILTTAHDVQPRDTFLALHILRTVEGNQGRDMGVVLPPLVTQHLMIVQQMEGCWERVAIGSYVVDSGQEISVVRQNLRLG